MSRDQILADALRLEDKELEARKDLWVLGCQLQGEEMLLIVEAVTSPGAVAVAQTWGFPQVLDGDVTIHGPHSREKWPESYWYRWLTEADVARMEEEIAQHGSEPE